MLSNCCAAARRCRPAQARKEEAIARVSEGERGPNAVMDATALSVECLRVQRCIAVEGCEVERAGGGGRRAVVRAVDPYAELVVSIPSAPLAMMATTAAQWT